MLIGNGTNGAYKTMLNGFERNALYWNRGDGRFEEVGYLAGANRVEDGRGVAVADFDRDGQLDMVVQNLDKPAVLLMDEPFAAVDAQTRETLQEELLRIWQAKKMTIVFVTHGIEEAVYLSERVVVMGKGSVDHDVAVDAPYPRGYEFRTSGELNRLRHELHELLR